MTGQEIRDIRHKCGMTQIQFCAAIGKKSIPHLSKVEKGRLKPSYGMISAIHNMICNSALHPSQAMQLDTLTAIRRMVDLELASACSKHRPLNSAHEAYAVILEELEEFKAEVFKNREQLDRMAMRNELVQTAAMCIRAIHDLKLNE